MQDQQLQSSPPDGLPDEEMNLVDLWPMLCAGWHLILSGLAAGLAVASGYLTMTPSQYEATLLVRVGYIGVAGTVQQIEAPGYAIERMRVPGFENAVLESLGWKGDARDRLFRHSFQVTSTASKYLKIRLYGFSPDDARRGADASLAVLTDIHHGLAEAIVAKRERKFANTVADIADAEAFLSRMESLGKEISPGDHQATLIWMQAMKDERSHLRVLRMQESVMKESLKPELTMPTMAAEPVAVSSDPVHPKARRVWIFAVVGGFLLGVLLVSLRSLASMNEKNRAAAA